MFDSEDAAKDAMEIMEMIRREQPDPPWRIGTEVAIERLTASTVISRIMPAMIAILQVAINYEKLGNVSISIEVAPVTNDGEVLQ